MNEIIGYTPLEWQLTKLAELGPHLGFARILKTHELAENVYSIPEVISESCDRTTRARYKVLPFDITFKQPSSEALLFVTEFAKKTGDYRSLSAVDLKILALVFDLEKQFKGTGHIKKEPLRSTITEGATVATSLIEGLDEDDNGGDDDDSLMNEDENQSETLSSEADNEIVQPDDTKEEEEEEMEEDDDDDEDNDGGWITPSNVDAVKKSMGFNTVSADDIVCVGCLTTDFAMQNVLIQMGLNVISVDGLLIKQARSYVLRCFGCMRITKDTTKVFCPHCGNKTLRKLTTTIAEDGTLKYHLARRYTISKRGTQFSLPAPKGGKYALNPRLVEDQPIPQQRITKKAREKYDIMSADIVAGMSPFKANDVSSKSAQLGFLNRTVPQWAKRNPNENRKKSGKNRRKK